MSRIDELVNELCPSGTRFLRLSDVTEDVQRIDWKKNKSKSFQYIDLASVDKDRSMSVQTSAIDVDSAPSRAQQLVRLGDVLFGTTRPLLSRFAHVDAELDGSLASTGYCVLRANPELMLHRFLFHSVQTTSFMRHVGASQQGASYPSITDSAVKKYVLSVPPIEVQHEIVSILDKFTELEARLEAELEARITQREYLIRSIQSGSHPLLRDATALTLNEIAVFESGKPHEPFVDPEGDCELITAKFISSNGSQARRIMRSSIRSHALIDDIVTVLSDLPNGRALGKCFLVRENNKFGVNQRIAILRVNDENTVNPEYLYHFLNRNPQILTFDNGSTQTHLKKPDVMNTKIRLPSLDIQRSIARSCSEMEKLVLDLHEGLPAEIAARRKQYEYYRDKLLTFKELEVA
jgi:type I restriction enzyme S subunit